MATKKKSVNKDYLYAIVDKNNKIVDNFVSTSPDTLRYIIEGEGLEADILSGIIDGDYNFVKLEMVYTS